MFLQFNAKNFYVYIYRSRRSEMFYKIDVLKNFAKFPGRLICRSLFFNKVTGYQSTTGCNIINTSTAGAIFRNPPRNADDKFIRHAEATSEIPMTHILVISYPFRNADDEISRHSCSLGFFFISTLHLIFTLISVHFVILVTFLPCLLKLF